MAFQVKNKRGKHVDCQYRGVIGCKTSFLNKTLVKWEITRDYVKKKKGLSRWRVLACPYGWQRIGGHSFYVSYNAGFNGRFSGEEV